MTNKPPSTWKITYETGETFTVQSKINPGGVAKKVGKARGYGIVKSIRIVPPESLNKPTEPKEQENGYVATEFLTEFLPENPVDVLNSFVIDEEKDDALITIICNAYEASENTTKRLEKLLEFCGDSNEIFDAEFLAAFADTIGIKATILKELILDIISNLEGKE